MDIGLFVLATEYAMPIDELSVSVFAAPPKWITRFADAGVKRNILIVPAEGSDATLKRLDTYAEFLSGSA